MKNCQSLDEVMQEFEQDDPTLQEGMNQHRLNSMFRMAQRLHNNGTMSDEDYNTIFEIVGRNNEPK